MQRPFVIIGTLVLALIARVPATAPAIADSPVGTMTPATAPAGTESLGAAWYSVAAPGGKSILTAVFDPRGDPTQPVPAIVLLHGSHGFAREYVSMAQELAQQTGYVTAAGCWFRGQVRADSEITPIDCPQGPDFVGATAAAWPVVDTLDSAIRAYAGGGPLTLFGHSRGGEVALQMASNGYNIQAIVANSAVYREPGRFDTPAPFDLAANLAPPLLALHGAMDTVVPIAEAERYFAAVQGYGVAPFSAHCYPASGHNAALRPGLATHTDAVPRIAQFVLGTLPAGSNCPQAST